ncbi:MAG TPA: DUF4135 domain-containing protein [Stenomitos sp.]
MFDQFDLTQLAYRASNLAERLYILKRLTDATSVEKGIEGHVSTALLPVPLGQTEIQVINQELERLFPNEGRSPKTQMFYRVKRQAVKRALRHYRWYGLNLKSLTTPQLEVFQTVHAAWLHSYEQAIATVLYPAEAVVGAQAGESAQRGCAPFLRFIATRLSEVSRLASFPPHRLSPIAVDTAIVETAQQWFWQRVQPMVASALEADEHLHQANLAAADPRMQARIYHQFYLRFPVLARWLAQLCGDWVAALQEALVRLMGDCADLSQRWWNGVAVTRIVQLRLSPIVSSASEPCLCFTLELADAQRQQVFYYPHCLHAELGLQTLYAELDGDRSMGAVTQTILCKTGYGYINGAKALVNRNPLQQYQQMGQNLAFRQLLGPHRKLGGHLQVGIDPSEVSGSTLAPGRSMEPSAWLGVNATAHEAQSAIRQGFQQFEQWLSTTPQQSVLKLERYFATAIAQLRHRPVGTYRKLLKRVQTASYLANPLAVDAVFRVLIDHPCVWDALGEISQLEVKMLWQQKEVCLTVPMNGRYLLYDNEHALFSKLPTSPLAYMGQRLQQLCGYKLVSAPPGDDLSSTQMQIA